MNLFDSCAHPLRIHGCLLEAPLHGVFIGEICLIERDLCQPQVIAKAQVVGFREGMTILSLIGRAQGLTREVVIRPTGQPFVFEMGDHLAGKIYNAAGEEVGVLSNVNASSEPPLTTLCRVDSPPVSVNLRRPVTTPLMTGVRAIDGLLTCGQGQRMGIFAAAGSGKTSLMSMIMNHAVADICVIALIGERGREVTEFIHELQSSPCAAQTILVYATSDSPAVERCNAALLATAMAEYFRDQGKDVLLFVDSMTRYARALRDVALAAGELPARRGYPASVFEQLPLLLERPGALQQGSITAFYTVLLESEEESDPIGDEIRSIIDGHIYLGDDQMQLLATQQLAAQPLATQTPTVTQPEEVKTMPQAEAPELAESEPTAGRRTLSYTFSQWKNSPTVKFELSKAGELTALTNSVEVQQALQNNHHLLASENPLHFGEERRDEEHERRGQHQSEQEDET